MCYRGAVRWFVLLAGCLSGCLYVADRNHSPVGFIQVPAMATRCGDAVLSVRSNDPDDDPVSYAWFVQVRSDEPDQPGIFDLASPSGPFCPQDPPSSPASTLEAATGGTSGHEIGSNAVLRLYRLPVRGTYTVDLRLRDALGAESLHHAEFKVGNASPHIVALHIDQDPARPSDRPDYTLPDLNGNYPAHGDYVAWIEKIEDADDDSRCVNTANKQLNTANKQLWEPVGRSAEEFEHWDQLCDVNKYPYGAQRFRLRPELAQKAGELKVKVTVVDALGAKTSAEVGRQVAANRSPCIIGTQPYSNAPLKLRAAEQNLFSVQISDDVPQKPELAWSFQDEGAASFSMLPSASNFSYPSSSYYLPAWFRSPGKKLRLRASVRELGDPAPSCPAGEARCGCNLLAQKECCQWITWSVEFQ